jgi:hypothetical protein
VRGNDVKQWRRGARALRLSHGPDIAAMILRGLGITVVGLEAASAYPYDLKPLQRKDRGR